MTANTLLNYSIAYYNKKVLGLLSIQIKLHADNEGGPITERNWNKLQLSFLQASAF